MGHSIRCFGRHLSDDARPPTLFRTWPQKSLQFGLQTLNGRTLSYPIWTQNYAEQAVRMKPCASAPESVLDSRLRISLDRLTSGRRYKSNSGIPVLRSLTVLHNCLN